DLAPDTFTSTDEQLPAIGCCSRTSSAVGVCSIARRKRNHDAKGIRRVLSTGTSPRSRAIIPKPLLCRSRSVTFSICSSCDSQRRVSGFFHPDNFPRCRFRLSSAAKADDDCAGLTAPIRLRSGQALKPSTPAGETRACWRPRSCPSRKLCGLPEGIPTYESRGLPEGNAGDEPPVFSQPVSAAEECLRNGYFSPQRTHSKRLISLPAAAADAGSKTSLASTSAQTSPRSVARASAKSNTLVLPDEAVPQISVRQPRARPPVSKSSCGIPLDTISGAGRTSRREAGTTAASFGMAPTRAKISAVERGEERGEKIKGRLMAADEKTGEADILSHIVREHGAGSARASR